MLVEMVEQDFFYLYKKTQRYFLYIFSFHAILLINPNEFPGLCVNNQHRPGHKVAQNEKENFGFLFIHKKS